MHPLPTCHATNPPPPFVAPFDGNMDFICWFRRLQFHLDDVPLVDRSRVVLRHLDDEQLDWTLNAGLSRHAPFKVHCDHLQGLFQPPLSIEEAIEQLFNHRLQAQETPRQIADTLLRLNRDIFPFITAADRDQVVLCHFKRGLDSQELA
ncbi:unnamed protein product [Schistocephalus solidus]|uniref:Uncharacterized protein n=1 Tax=Schistocephalus solidus TaxID=70667 RepID=A0A183SC16_SCHSO|nr:unnamed protein product [Schistocephalus solidus]